MKHLSAMLSRLKRKRDEKIERRNNGASANASSPQSSYVDTAFSAPHGQLSALSQLLNRTSLPKPPRYVDTAYPSYAVQQSFLFRCLDMSSEPRQQPAYVDTTFIPPPLPQGALARDWEWTHPKFVPTPNPSPAPPQPRAREYLGRDSQAQQQQRYVDKPFPVYGTQIERAQWYRERRAQQSQENNQSEYRKERPQRGQNQDMSTPVHYCANPRLIESSTSAASSKSQDVISASKLVVTQDLATDAELSTIKFLRVARDETGVIDSPTISFSLETFSWKSCPNYVALSYVWGNDIPEYTVLVNGKEHLVQRNLYSALRHIVQKKLPVFFWADAICINQDDEDEKSQVVQHMGAIFSRAGIVYAWLTPDDEGSDRDDERHKHLLDTLNQVGSLFWKNSGSSAEKLSEAELDLVEILRLSVSRLVELFFCFTSRGDVDTEGFPISDYTRFSNNPYWQRIWVLQEVYLAQSLLFFYGPFAIQSRILSGALILLEQFQKYIVSGGDTLSARLRTNPRLRRFAFESPSFPEMHRLVVYTSIYPAGIVSLRVAMANFCVKELPRGSRAKDPRDMVFGLLGFATESEKGEFFSIPSFFESLASELFQNTSRPTTPKHTKTSTAT